MLRNYFCFSKFPSFSSLSCYNILMFINPSNLFFSLHNYCFHKNELIFCNSCEKLYHEDFKHIISTNDKKYSFCSNDCLGKFFSLLNPIINLNTINVLAPSKVHIQLDSLYNLKNTINQ